MARAANSKGRTRIQQEKTEKILAAALDVFSAYGFRGSTIDQVAERAGLSKPNLLYYFDNKEAIHAELIKRMLYIWLDPLHQVREEGDPIEEICAYVQRKLEMARDYPRESRLFANEMLQGAPRIGPMISGPLKTMVDEKAALIESWSKAGKIADVDAYHLLFSIWSTTQHYADFDVQVTKLMGKRAKHRFTDASKFLDHLFRSALQPE
ncbi:MULTISPECIES: TetR family transcriptional regulator C-terminal domain-containing protein [Pseudovibrio]|uniref:TetR family transcriptional regulator C-terminal domain-containing protein n=1 Tax=Stappiaceae TaxID=2821832 RepID=UPI00236717E3|nr:MULTISPECIES: TetR family transcriptional regulator C-terminal domain-containing protein [Pseudovibrio]MDD7911470.1 TetR family transcriptional regulator C-terminal domain-containing protein [Pseudovibrio exalbescens]MDX5594235.1 TetR family transcriptional regulator C-terminal domain-containing protein [Pseudovibrio sp. SPO723]